ncbi:MAG: c-type cytochrome [Verrucomicrobia bacterium]|nr:c-type cytochrome [Verrucomicrobiota bacterium]
MRGTIWLGMVLVAGSLFGQEAVGPTSVALEETLRPVFGAAKGPCAVETEEAYSNFRIVLGYDAAESAGAKLVLAGEHEIELPAGENRLVEVAYEHVGTGPARVRVWEEGRLVEKGRDLAVAAAGGGGAARVVVGVEESRKTFRFDGDFTAMVRFQTEQGGTLVAKAPEQGKWEADAKAFYIRDGRLVYDIGWLGSVSGQTKANDGKEHVAVLVVKDGKARIVLDGKTEGEKADMARPDKKEFVFKVGAAAPDFGGDYAGEIGNVRFWKRALDEGEVKQLSSGKEDAVNTPDYNWAPGGEAGKGKLVETSFGAVPGYATKVKLVAGAGFALKSAVVQPLERTDHAALVRGWDAAAYERGKVIYGQLCVTCHGTVKAPGSLPTALRFAEGEFKNGSDPYRMFQTLEKGYGMMVAQPQYSTAQKYDVIHYLREEFLKGRNATQYAAVEKEYLERLPQGMSLVKEEAKMPKQPQYLLQDFGNVLFWTLQVEPGNIAQKGIAVRLDAGPGGISKGKKWALYEHDTMRLAAVWSGDAFVDWKGIAFDGSHGTHTSIVGEKAYVSPDAPAWANSATGDFKDLRILGRDGKPYGPLPREWVRFGGVDLLGDKAVISYTVGDRKIREYPSLSKRGALVRVMEVGPSKTALKLRLEGEEHHVFEGSGQVVVYAVTYGSDGIKAIKMGDDFKTEFEGAKTRRYPGTLTTEIGKGADDGPFAVDVLTPPAPNENPWQSWMRTSGFDFFEGGKSAAVCTWNGDVWIVDGIDQAEGTLRWQRICAGLFQPLGLKIVNGEVYVGCRDMIAKLLDTNGDGETDMIESFNSDHQVTEHFHEFAMGLQTDAEGNFYYAKSARHAKTAVVPHHGTLLKVSKDGLKTTILATGFRAANGVCLNPDGTFIVTDQEGHWNPKNRINWVQGSGVDDFYGNMYGYHNVTDESDEAMVPPLCWITNKFDRSPAELLWVPEDAAWESLRGSLLNLSYGYGKVFVVPYEKVGGQVQGGMCELPIPQFPTGVMRGRFHPGDGQLYACGMFAWAGNQSQPGGFYRVRATGKAVFAPVGLRTAKGTVVVTFTDALEKESAEKAESWTVEAWNLKRTKDYGSKHFDQRGWKVEKAVLSADGRSVTLSVPELVPSWGMSISCAVRGAGGEEVKREIHNTVHTVGE